jgi:MFS family permease
MPIPSSGSAPARSAARLAAYLGIVQFFFATTWTLYVIYLPQLAREAGIGRQWIPWILVADQVVFALADILTGFWMDRVRGAIARFGGWMLGATVVSGLAFLALPYFNASAAMLLAAVFVWAVSSAALRSPPWLLLSRHAAAPSVPWLAAIVLTGGAVASAVAPYLGIALKGVDPRLPFVLSTLTLIATVAGLVVAERRSLAVPSVEQSPESGSNPILFYLALLVMAVGFQVHFSLNSAPQYLKLAPAGDLPWLMPVFWVGFNLLMFPAAALVKRLGAIETMAVAGAAGAVATLSASLATHLGSLAAAQFLAGGCWGAASAAAYTAALSFGRTGKEGRYLGTLFAVLALAAFARIAAYASDLIVEPRIGELLPWIPEAAWSFSAVVLLLAAASRAKAARAAGRP